MASPFQIFSKIVYAFIYTFLHIIVTVLLLVSPGDIINQSRIRGDTVPIIIVSVAYVTAILIVIFVFFLRLFINRAVLNSIPKSWVPIEKGDVRKHVHKMIAAGLSRSAAIAFVSRPRIMPEELLEDMCPMLSPAGPLMMSGGRGEKSEPQQIDHDEETEKLNESNPPPSLSSPGKKAVRFKRVETVEKEKELGIDLPPCVAVWGEIEHPGWAPPNQPVPGLRRRNAGTGTSAGGSSGDAGGSPPAALGSNLDGEELTLQYSTVVVELPLLIEAKALTLAPPDPTSQSHAPQLDPEALALLQRPIYKGLREYLAHLTELGVIDLAAHGSKEDWDEDKRSLGEILPSFVATYEYARFSTQMLTQRQFRQLMHDLASILRRMKPLDPNLLLDDGDDDGGSDGDSYSAYAKDDSYAYSEGDSRPFYSGYSGYSGRSQHTQDSTDSDDDIDNTGARSSPTTLNRSCSRSQKQRGRHQQEESSMLSREEDVEESDGTSRRRPRASRNANSHSGALLQSRSRPRNLRQVSSHSSSSGNSFAQSRNPYTVNSQPSSSSLRSGLSGAPSAAASTLSARSASMASMASRTSTASDGGSVIIRLADRHEQSQGLPYVLTLSN